ncbi:flagellar biosynthetic protein FliO [Silvimonas sp.]|uniref:flagellar biosynthetic protein FliO n=1 Tax=Silvimonas sp. TaxID=2650811 RepID=UPI00284FB4A4|nr:flagellar biosynthetic protein FliO [Silvimonas sp.]MDR3426253.1 flagellar biosynthetic protein FliO [Silvimonas sp.]
MLLNRITLGAVFTLSAGTILAATSASAVSAAIPAATSASSFGQLAQVVLALVFVLGLIFVSAMLMRRFSLLPGMAAGNRLRVVSGAMVGPKERVVVVELDNTWLVVGVTPHAVNLLHTQAKPDDAPAAPVPPQFATRLAEIIARKRPQA